MKSQYVGKLQDGDTVNDYFVATRKDLRTQQNGSKFLGMVFKDRTGEVGGILWQGATEVAKQFEQGDVVNVRGRVTTYQGNLQIHVEQVLPMRANEYDTTDLVYVPESAGEDLGRLEAILGSIENPWLRRLVDRFVQDKGFMDRFSAAAAAKKWHHAYSGGLVRHCLEMARLTETVCELFPELNRDLILTAVLLHDAGKLYEMRHDLYVDYTTEGKLIGHIQIGVDLANEAIRGLEGFPEDLRLHLIHLILSHHGEAQNGSPVVPKTPEAVALHHIDNLDAQTAAFLRIVQETREKRQAWSDYNPLIGREIWAQGP